MYGLIQLMYRSKIISIHNTCLLSMNIEKFFKLLLLSEQMI